MAWTNPFISSRPSGLRSACSHILERSAFVSPLCIKTMAASMPVRYGFPSLFSRNTLSNRDLASGGIWEERTGSGGGGGGRAPLGEYGGVGLKLKKTMIRFALQLRFGCYRRCSSRLAVSFLRCHVVPPKPPGRRLMAGRLYSKIPPGGPEPNWTALRRRAGAVRWCSLQ